MRFPFFEQYDNKDCGAACLRMISAFYGKRYSQQEMHELCYVGKEGVSMLGISDAAESIGLRTCGVKITWKQLRDEAPLPCIVHWSQKHFIVVYRIRKKKGGCIVDVADPAEGLLSYSENSFLRQWLSPEGYGLALLFSTTPSFFEKESKKYKSRRFYSLLGYLRPYGGYIVQITAAMAVAAIISMIIPSITKAIVDVGIKDGNLSFIAVMLIAHMVLVCGQLVNDLIRSWLMLHVTSRVSISLMTDFLKKLMKLPISFFDSRNTGDIIQRLGDTGRIESFLTGSVLSIIIAVVSFAVYGTVMAGYNVSVFLIFFIGTCFYVIWVLLFLKHRRKIDYARFQEAAINQDSIVNLIEGMQDIKLNSCEKRKRWSWEEVQARIFKINIRSLALGQYQEAGGTFIDQIKNLLITFVSARGVVNGDMSLGMMMALQYIIGQMNAPISQFISFVQSWQDASISLERFDEIDSRKDEDEINMDKIREIPAYADIVFDNVTFQYSGPRSAKVLDGVSLRIPAHKVTAIVGTSGSGKTTMLKLMMGFYPPISGQLFLGDRPLSDYNNTEWRKFISCVMQEGYIFPDSIAKNISISEDEPDMLKVRTSAAVSNIEGWINGLPLGYHTRIGASGHGLSTGQKQRILIARAAYKNAPYLFLDEATNSLDANNEKAIISNLAELMAGKTVVIVAHRLSTVKNADKIVVLDNGHIVEEGTHTELVARRGAYFKLIKNQLELGN